MKKNITSTLLCILLTVPNFSYAKSEINKQDINSAVLADYETGDIMYSHNLDKTIEIASITKIMTYLVVMDEVSEGRAKLRDMVVISEKAAARGGSSFYLEAGQVYRLDRLIDSIMIASANDACIAIAEHITGDEKSFADLMNKKAQELNLEKSHFISVNGYPEEGSNNIMSSRDILKLTLHTINKYPQILETTSKKMLIDKSRDFEFINTNPLLGYLDGIIGLKTGYADDAGYCLVSIKKVRNGDKLVAILMGAKNEDIRKKESLKLLESDIGKEYKKEKILEANKAIDSLKVSGSANGKIKVFAEKDIYGMVCSGEDISKTINLYNNLEFPVKPGDIIGEVTVKYDDNVKKVNLIAKEELLKYGIINKAKLSIMGFLENVF